MVSHFSEPNVVGHRFAHHERWSPTPKRYRRTRQPSNSRQVGDSVHRLVRLGCLAWRRPCSQNLNHLGLEEIFKLSYSFLSGVTELRGKRVDLDEIQLLDILAQRSHLIARAMHRDPSWMSSVHPAIRDLRRICRGGRPKDQGVAR